VILNLTNPLSSSTAIIQSGFSNPVLGVCELPQFTMESACQVLNVPSCSAEWEYSGLNHRGFIHRLSFEGRDLLAELAQGLGGDTIGGVTAQEIAELHALPLKYFILLRKGRRGPTASRSLYLAELKHRIEDEIRANPNVSPPSLAERDPVWYSDALVPIMVALGQREAREVIVNRAHSDGLVYEELACVGAEGIEPKATSPLPKAAAEWIERFREHERCVLHACRDPNFATVSAALEADPLMPATRAAESANALLESLNALREGQARPAHDPATLTM
jgi:6-phospho-beta-glucosidase